MRFRRQALRHLEAPEQLDQVVRLASARSWLLGGALLVLVATSTIWSCLGYVTRTVGAAGMLIHSHGISRLDATEAGDVIKVWTDRNRLVAAGSPLFTLRDEHGGLHTIQSSWDAYVVAILVTEGGYVVPGTQVASLERVTGSAEPLVAVVFVPATSAPMIGVGAAVRLTAPAAPASTFGTLAGVVVSVDAFPETEETLRSFLGDAADVSRFLHEGPVVRVSIKLATSSGSTTALHWSKTTPPFQLNSESALKASFTITREHPISWLLGS